MCTLESGKLRVGSQWPETAFSAEELYFLEYGLNSKNKSLSDTSEQEERGIQKCCDLCYKGGWQKTLASIVCFSHQFYFNNAFHGLEAKGDWKDNVFTLMVVSIFLYLE